MRKLFFYSFFFLTAFSFVLTAQPEPPQNLIAELTQNFHGPIVKLNWDGVTEHHFNTKYRIYRAEGAIADSAEFIVIHNGVRRTDFFDHWVEGGNTYSYFVTALNQDGESEASNMAEITIELVGVGTITGSVNADDTGDPLEHTRVKLIPVESGRMKFTYTDSLGNYSLNVPAGDYFVRFEKWGYWFEFYDDTREFSEATPVTLIEDETLTVSAGLEVYTPPAHYTLSGNVSDLDGNPLAARVKVLRVAHNSHHFRHGHARTDSLGNYSVTLREGDSVAVFVHPFDNTLMPEFYDDKSSFEEADKVYIDGDIEGIDFVLESKPVLPNGIAGVVKDTLGNGVESLLKAFRVFTPDRHQRVYSVASDSFGVYEFSNMIPGDYFVFAKPNGNYMPTFFKYDGSQSMHWWDADSVAVDSFNVVQDINFTVLERPEPGEGYISGTVLDHNSNVIAGAYVFIMNEDGSFGTYAVSDNEGKYIVDGLVPGNYSVFGDKVNYMNETSLNVSVDYYTNLSQSADIVLKSDEVTTIENDETIVEFYTLDQNYPNPFNPSTVISFTLPEASNVKLSIFNVLGQKVAELVNSNLEAGTHNVDFSASHMSSGVYLYKLETPQFSATRKMILIK
ncbi:MAG: hypothetical protein SCALA702_35660 [Melioribacteraceae bacterium]|nr:MAG: hypothetical protein SCALA702_35660 [Melioribacteraceae bacterium]